MSNKKGIQKHCEYLESKIRKKQFKLDKLNGEKEDLIKYLENKIRILKNKGASYGLTIDYDIAEYIDNKIEAYQDILERLL